MPVSIVVGGQFGSEGKGKVALEIARRATDPVVVVRVGGPNSGHTAYTRTGRKYILRQLPAGCIDRDVEVILPAGSYIDVDVLRSEMKELDYPPEHIRISHHARLITDQHKQWEAAAKLADSIGSTGSGVGAAVMASVARGAENVTLQSFEAADHPSLERFICDTSDHLRRRLAEGYRIVVEGTQGFGLSLLEGGYWPKATSRSTTAAGALAETGLSPFDVDDVTMVIRSFPIRVDGNSGPLIGETTWEHIAREAGTNADLREYTTVTKRLRRVGYFDPVLVQRALVVNRPTRLVLNHLDHIGDRQDLDDTESRLSLFLNRVETGIGRKIDWFGFSGLDVIERETQEA